MEKQTRTAIERATQRSRWLLEDEYAAQLEGTFDILRDGTIAAVAGAHLSAKERHQRDTIVAAIQRKRAGGMDAKAAVADYLRDAAFTTVNRFVALKLLEARKLLQECVSKGEQSAGYVEFCGMAPGLPLLPDAAGYRLYLESLFDELSTEVKVLFDRRDPASVLWPRRQAFDALLATLNADELSTVWSEDETLGWVYQYFNGADERKRMREESQAPRNSHELAVRNQFFTPRYVVQFLTDNTLGRTWLEMHGEDAPLADALEYFVRPVDEPRPRRSKKDPRDLKVLDPASGSGHFLLYSFDLLARMYEEAWAAGDASPASKLTGGTMRADYTDLDALRRAAPALIVENNLYGVDIDARCAQIAALALWLRAQRSYQELGIPAAERPRIARTHIVIAEPMPGDRELAAAFGGQLGVPFLRTLFDRMVFEMRLAGELGSLLQVERSLAEDISRARRQYLAQQDRPDLFPDLRPRQQQGRLDLSGVTDDSVFEDAEHELFGALVGFAESAGGADARRRMFAGDAAQGVALIDLVRTRFDVVLMNPPFGLMPRRVYDYLVEKYPTAYYDLAAAFMARGVMLLAPGGLCGALTTRAFQTVVDAASFREAIFIRVADLVADLGSGVMDGAAVDASAQVLAQAPTSPLRILDLRESAEKASELLQGCRTVSFESYERSAFDALPAHRLAYDALRSLSHVYSPAGDGVEPRAAIARTGATTFDDERFLRCRWEVRASDLGSRWLPSSRSAEEFSLYYFPPLYVVKWDRDGREVCARNELANGSTAQARQGSSHYGRPGALFSRRSSPSIAFRAHPSGSAFASNTGVVLPEGSVAAEALLAFLNSTPVRAAVNALSNRDSYTVGHIKRLRWPYSTPGDLEPLRSGGLALLRHRHFLYRLEETDPWFVPREILAKQPSSSGSFETHQTALDLARESLLGASRDVEVLVGTALEIDDIDGIRAQFGVALDDVLKPGRLFEVTRRQWFERCILLALGVAFGRWDPEAASPATGTGSALGVIPRPPAPMHSHLSSGTEILVDDPGHDLDVVAAIWLAWRQLWPADPQPPDALVRHEIGADLRDFVATQLFKVVGRVYSAGKRTAPAYLQLSVPSGKYSVWLNVAGMSVDTLYKARGDILAPKVALEERRLMELEVSAASGGSATGESLRQMEAQREHVSELRDMYRQLTLAAQLWQPDFDDGYLILLAPLWRLVPDRLLQKELATHWTRLTSGDLDWSATAARLWPERVVPRCAEDRSLAIAHGLEDVFWAEGADGKWSKRSRPSIPLETLVAERTSPAVKAALADLQAAPAPAAARGRGRARE